MKRLLSLVTLLAATSAWAQTPAPVAAPHVHDENCDHDDDGPAATTVLPSATPLVIDGRLDEAAWADATAIPVQVRVGKLGEKSDVPRMIVKYTWDDQYLYIGYETFDANLVALADKDLLKGPAGRQRQGATIFQKDAKPDVVEFFVTFGDPHFFWELHHNAQNNFNDIWCVTADPSWPIAKSSFSNYGILFNRQEFVADDGEFTVAMAVHPKPKADGSPSTINDPSDTDTGYTAELRFPWKSIAAPVAAQTWIKPVAKGAPRTPGPWKMAGYTMTMLAVVQDGDLKDRYHHDGTGPIPSWFHKSQDAWPTYTFKLAGSSPRAVMEQLMERADANDVPAVLVKDASDLGLPAVLAGLEFLAENKPVRAQVLYEVMTTAGNSRRTDRELLRLYHPDAYRLFYTPEGAADQQKLGAGLAWKKWPGSLPDAVVGIAPVPLLAWLKAQAAAPKPALDKLALLSRSLGWWLRTDCERQHADAFREAITALSANPVIAADPVTATAVVRLIADARATAAVPFVITQLESQKPDVRSAAIDTLGRLARTSTVDPSQLIRVSVTEPDASVLNHLAVSAESWSADPKIGEALLALYQRTTDTEVRRSILFTVARATWPQRAAIIKAAFAAPGGGVVAVALDALAAKPIPELSDAVFELVNDNADSNPQLIDAAGAYGEARFAPTLLKWLKAEKNIAVQAKLLLALEKIPGDVTSQALADQLGQTADPYLATTLCHIASRRDLPAAVPVLVGLAEDSTAPMPVRAQAIWALGRYTIPAARDSLARLRAEPAKFFKTDEGAPLVPENLEQVRLYLALAALRQNDKAAEAEVRQRFTDGTPGTQLACLLALAEIRRDDSLIATGLNSADYAVFQGAVQAAALANPAAYRDRLAALEKSPWISALLTSGLDLAKLPAAFDYALRNPGATP